MGRRESQLNPQATALERFAHDLRELRREAGGPSYRHLSQIAHYSASALSTAANGRVLPSLPVLEAYVRACGGDEEEWRRRWHELSVNPAATPAPIAESGEGFTADLPEAAGTALGSPAVRATPRGHRRMLIAVLVVLAVVVGAVTATSLMTASGSDVSQTGLSLPGVASTVPAPGTACRPDMPDGDLLPEPTGAKPGEAVEASSEMDFAAATTEHHLWGSWDGSVPKEAETITSDVTYQGKKTMQVVVPPGIAMIGSKSMHGLKSRDKVTISLWYGGQGSAIICPIVQEAGTFHEYFPEVSELKLTSGSKQGWRTYQWTIPDISAHNIQGTAIEIVNTGAANFVFYLGAIVW